MTHLISGCEDGYIRDYDFFAGLNGKNLLTAPQRHHCGVGDGVLKGGVIWTWWGNTEKSPLEDLSGMDGAQEPTNSSIYSIALHSDALWGVSGTLIGHINLFTLRHEPGRIQHTLYGHKGPISALSLTGDEMGVFSAGWDGHAMHWDLTTGQPTRVFPSSGAQLTAISPRPLTSASQSAWSASPHKVTIQPDILTSQFPSFPLNESDPNPLAGMEPFMQFTQPPVPQVYQPQSQDPNVTSNGVTAGAGEDAEAEADDGFDPLFDDEPDDANPSADPLQPDPLFPDTNSAMHTEADGTAQFASQSTSVLSLGTANFATFSPDILMTTRIDGQILLWDRRVNSPGQGVGRLELVEKCPPWCVSNDGRYEWPQASQDSSEPGELWVSLLCCRIP
jgi:transcriptional activator SPT8